MRGILPLVVAVASVVTPAGAADPACATGALGTVPTGVVVEAACDSDALGGVSPFSYFVPAGCSTSNRCPVLYLLHGFNGTHRSMLGTPGAPSSFVRALTEDPVTGADRPDLPMILVAPHGRTVGTTRPGAPPADQESFWVDWNPRYWTNPPRFEAFVTEELRGLVERSLPAIATREGRAIDGISLGGFGAFKLGLQHPHTYASAGSMSGALNVLVVPALQPVDHPGALPGGPAASTPYLRQPRVIRTPPGFPFGDPFGAFGDPQADEVYFRGNNPLDLALNARGLPLRFIHNDTIPRRWEDFGNATGFASAYGLEAVVMPMNLEFRAAMTQHGNSDFHYALNAGLHSGYYWDPQVRAQFEWHWARVSHPGDPIAPQVPQSFSFRSIRDAFSAWGWDVEVDREPLEFLTLHGASRAGVTVVGSGSVTLTTPAFGATGATIRTAPGSGHHTAMIQPLPGGRMRISFPLGPSGPTDEHLGSGGVPGAQHSAHVCLIYGPSDCP